MPVSAKRQAELKELNKDRIMDEKFRKEIEPMLLQITIWGSTGCSLEEIANSLGMTERTLFRYREKYPQIDQAIAQGHEIEESQVKNALYKLAKGFEYVEVKSTYVRTTGLDEEGKEKFIKKSYEENKKVCLPNLNAITFILTNKFPNEWKKSVNIESFNKSLQYTALAGMNNISNVDIKKVLDELDKGKTIDGVNISNIDLLDVESDDDDEEDEELLLKDSQLKEKPDNSPDSSKEDIIEEDEDLDNF